MLMLRFSKAGQVGSTAESSVASRLPGGAMSIVDSRARIVSPETRNPTEFVLFALLFFPVT
jgi:hypothetical protein